MFTILLFYRFNETHLVQLIYTAEHLPHNSISFSGNLKTTRHVLQFRSVILSLTQTQGQRLWNALCSRTAFVYIVLFINISEELQGWTAIQEPAINPHFNKQLFTSCISCCLQYRVGEVPMYPLTTHLMTTAAVLNVHSCVLPNTKIYCVKFTVS